MQKKKERYRYTRFDLSYPFLARPVETETNYN